MRPAALLSLGCLVAVCWLGAGSSADACTCGMPETLEAFDRSVAVFEGTVLDRRITLFSQGPYWAPEPEQDIAVSRVWKGDVTSRVSVLYLNGGMCSSSIPVGMTALFFMTVERGRLAYHICSPNLPMTHAAKALALLGPPIATFSDRAPEVPADTAAMPLSRWLRARLAVGAAYYHNAQAIPLFVYFYPPLQRKHGLLLGVLILQIIFAVIFTIRRRPRPGLSLFATSALTTVILLLWTGHDLARETDLLRWP